MRPVQTTFKDILNSFVDAVFLYYYVQSKLAKMFLRKRKTEYFDFAVYQFDPMSMECGAAYLYIFIFNDCVLFVQLKYCDISSFIIYNALSKVVYGLVQSV